MVQGSFTDILHHLITLQSVASIWAEYMHMCIKSEINPLEETVGENNSNTYKAAIQVGISQVHMQVDRLLFKICAMHALL